MFNLLFAFHLLTILPGSVMAVTVADANSPNKFSRFVGICIQRGGSGLRAWFILRNVVDKQGVEILYEMYCPLIQKIEVLRLERRLDESLLYLRDALPEYSTFPLDMEPERRLNNSVVPLNPLKVTSYISLVTRKIVLVMHSCFRAIR